MTTQFEKNVSYGDATVEEFKEHPEFIPTTEHATNAAKRGNLKVVKYLMSLTPPVKPSDELLEQQGNWVIGYYQAEVYEYLTNSEKYTKFEDFKVCGPNSKIAEFLTNDIKETNKYVFLKKALQKNNAPVVDYFLSYGAIFDIRELHELMEICIQNDSVEILKLLLPFVKKEEYSNFYYLAVSRKKLETTHYFDSIGVKLTESAMDQLRKDGLVSYILE